MGVVKKKKRQGARGNFVLHSLIFFVIFYDLIAETSSFMKLLPFAFCTLHLITQALYSPMAASVFEPSLANFPVHGLGCRFASVAAAEKTTARCKTFASYCIFISLHIFEWRYEVV